ncbi:unnamed protein product, partial [Polarella glacialis]
DNNAMFSDILSAAVGSLLQDSPELQAQSDPRCWSDPPLESTTREGRANGGQGLWGSVSEFGAFSLPEPGVRDGKEVFTQEITRQRDEIEELRSRLRQAEQKLHRGGSQAVTF